MDIINRPLDFSFVFFIKIIHVNKNSPQYIFDTGTPGINKDRISLYVLNNRLIFRVFDRTSAEYTIDVSSLIFNEFEIFSCEIKNKKMDCELIISKSFQEINKITTGFPLIFTQNPTDLNYFVGSDNEGENCGTFQVAEQLVIKESLNDQTSSKIHDYLTAKYSFRPKSFLNLDGKSYIYKDTNGTGYLIQANPDLQPKYING